MTQSTWSPRMIALALIGATAAASGAPVRAETTPQVTAMVESLSAPIAGLAALDYLPAGRALALPAGATLVLDYLGACVRETITAGADGSTVRIGPDQSAVTHGRVVRRRMDCDGDELQISAAQADVGGVAVSRGIGPALPSLTVHGTMPVIAAPLDAPVHIVRLDADAPEQEVRPSAGGGGGTGRTLIDLARAGTALAPGGTYRITQGQRAVVIRIDPAARPGPLPVMLRLVPL
ncbi:hypothetical protein [Acidisphaera rubrifaciens]|uniref:Uncharacterized protein n=1 Tax=Acidisphaera rubrifaciens HS-AP3 TaxID=1231350 RepID=A0A0D6P7N1_9PROT|nr:hypothetical protein [Acidisphaera rubrifaciens]GAN77770.1 hypothetical protein Asru_0454_02 [Acidisphaera rubrifaciens HS-AP3]